MHVSLLAVLFWAAGAGPSVAAPPVAESVPPVGYAVVDDDGVAGYPVAVCPWGWDSTAYRPPHSVRRPYGPTAYAYYYRPKYNYRKQFDFPWNVGPGRYVASTGPWAWRPGKREQIGEMILVPPQISSPLPPKTAPMAPTLSTPRLSR